LAYEAQKREANRLSESAIQYGLLKREADSNRQLYENLQERMKDAGVTAGLRSSNIRLIDSAETPLRPVSPSLAKAAYSGLFIGLLCSAVVVGFREGMNRTLQSAVEVELFTAMPSLALIPRRAASTQVCVSGVVASGNIASLTHPNSAVAEAFRGLGTSILLTAPALQVLVVTSPVSGEGKTTTAANTAVVLAQQGKRVLLVDADLRKPALHETFGVSNENGLNALLQGNVDQGGAIVRVPGAMIPDLLPAGAEASRPAELLGSAAMAELLNCWRHDYDYIIIDTPPMLAVTDALRLAAKADSVLLVVRASCTTREALSRACDVLNQTEVPVLGIVVNDIDVHSAGSYYYGCYPQLAKRYYCDD
jgi:capsular exopolysaccharide synthesis family protein